MYENEHHPVWGKLSTPWSSWMWEVDITVCFSKPSHGWVRMMLMAKSQHHVVECSNVFDPFWDMVTWLNAIAEDQFPASLLINEEGVVTRMTLQPFKADWLELWVDRPENGFEVNFGKGAQVPDQTDRWLMLCRVNKYQLLNEFHRRLRDFLERDFAPQHWNTSYWHDYMHDEERYIRYVDLRRLDLRPLARWLDTNRPRTMKIEKIISGGQTGADRAALDWAIEHGIPHGGWCPVGRLAEDGTLPERYQRQESPNGGGYRRRTKANVRDSDATLVTSMDSVLTGGSHQTVLFAKRFAKPWLHLNPQMDWQAALRAWLSSTPIHTLNVAGPSASREPSVANFTWTVLDEIQHILVSVLPEVSADSPPT